MSTRIGPRKLRRVLEYTKNSTITRRSSDYRIDRNHSRGPIPLTIEGNSYFDLPRNEDTRTPNSVITPTTFMNASEAKTPEPLSAIGRHIEHSEEQSAPNEDSRVGNVILLVEDNSINMRVRLPVANKTPLPHVSIVRASANESPAANGSHEEARPGL
jgi:hypothetical protein